MTGFLIDTHVLLWWADSPAKVTPEARLAMASGRNELFVSHASLWEMNIKVSRGKLQLPDTIDVLLQRARCTPLPITLEHVDAITSLPHHHRDPFDRMLIAQASTDKLTILTRDGEMQRYDVPIIAA